MVSVNVRVPGLDHAVSVEVGLHEGALFGRYPSVSRLLLDIPAQRLTPVTVASPHVSANHVVVWCTPEGVSARDLTSRNGSWVKLPPRQTVCLPTADVHLDLAITTESTKSVVKPAPDPGWTSTHDFGSCIAVAVTSWLDDLGIDAQVSLAVLDGVQFQRFPLADGATLTIAPRGAQTLDVRLPAALDEVAAYIDEQNVLLDQELGHEPDFHPPLAAVSRGAPASV